MAQAQPSWTHMVSLNEVSPEGRRFHLVADGATRDRVGAGTGLVELPRLEAEFEVRRGAGDSLRVTGEVSATVVQSCVVTLEPVTGEVREEVDVTFSADPGPPPEADEIEIDAEAADPPDPLVGGRVDLGAVAVEFLQLGLDPYPRRPDAAFEAPADEPAAANPFAALAALKNRQPGEG